MLKFQPKLIRKGNLNSANPLIKLNGLPINLGRFLRKTLTEIEIFFFSEAFVIFSGGMPIDQASRTPSITVVYNKTTTVLEMEHNVIDFVTFCDSPYVSGKFCPNRENLLN